MTTDAADAAQGPSALMQTLFAVATGALVANLYYAQPLVAVIGRELNVKPDVAGLVTSATQIGYGVGLLLLVPLADRMENRRLVLFGLAVTTLSLIGMALSTTAAPFFAAAFLIGVCSTGAQVLVPLAAHLAPEAQRGKVVGNVMGGLITGIMLARPLSLFVAASFGWRAVFWTSAVLMILIGAALLRTMPRHQPETRMPYGQILISMVGLLRDLPPLRWRAAYQALMFAGFNMFWTAAPLMLADRFGLDQHGIGLFALAGAGGALAAPFAGRLADRGLTRALSVGAMAMLGVSFLITGWAAIAMALPVLVIFAVILDGAVQTNQITSQKIIFASGAAIRGRVNALYMTCVFIGGAIGSVLGTLTYHQGGWTGTALVGAGLAVVALGLYAVEQLTSRRIPS